MTTTRAPEPLRAQAQFCRLRVEMSLHCILYSARTVSRSTGLFKNRTNIVSEACTKEMAHTSLHGNLLRSCVTFRASPPGITQGEKDRKEEQLPRREPALHVEVLPPAPAGGFEQTSERGEDEERRCHEKDQSKYPAATTNTTVMTYVERGTCQKIGPRVVAPHSRPPRRARSARGRSVRKNRVFGSLPWVVASF